MTKLEQLRQIVAEAFSKAEDKATIETFAAINKTLDEAQAEEQSLIEKNADLIKSYKDLVQHTSFNDVSTKPTDQLGGQGISFEDALQTFMSKQN